ncbi:antirestriction protein ArdA [Coralloluteibacterium stylophorae]|uniref:Antirestriction protein ArdA n=1 Tax=Coralloluteibacterium stylophorae TaxID=1776034 RepID=A0A8J7VTA5_9GAMM|nr:antirestriction protein ArdA [Coralloluteibacterium stylophorae]MBS7457712.1 antirestriction protein ArdA [Coralloluteibacterium stylophorae]
MPRIYVACLASYNNGRLHGRWIDLDGQDANDVRDEIAAMLRESPFPNVRIECPECNGRKSRLVASCVSPDREPCPVCNGTGKVPSAEEWAVHDYDDLPASWGEHPDLDKLLAYVEAVEDMDESDREAFDAWIDNYSGSDPDDTEKFREEYQGCFNTLTDYAEHIVEELGLLVGVPDRIANYFDYESFGRDLRLGGDVWTHEGDHGLHVFNNY